MLLLTTLDAFFRAEAVDEILHCPRGNYASKLAKGDIRVCSSQHLLHGGIATEISSDPNRLCRPIGLNQHVAFLRLRQMTERWRPARQHEFGTGWRTPARHRAIRPEVHTMPVVRPRRKVQPELRAGANFKDGGEFLQF